ncbi:MAG: hypothetical protein WHT46_06965 [Candidatus Geothermincolales bacterium]
MEVCRVTHLYQGLELVMGFALVAGLVSCAKTSELGGYVPVIGVVPVTCERRVVEETAEKRARI